MKTRNLLLILSFLAINLSACSVFKPKYGCPTNGSNVGAEKMLDGGGPKKTKKFKA